MLDVLKRADTIIGVEVCLTCEVKGKNHFIINALAVYNRIEGKMLKSTKM